MSFTFALELGTRSGIGQSSSEKGAERGEWERGKFTESVSSQVLYGLRLNFGIRVTIGAAFLCFEIRANVKITVQI